MSNMFEMSKSVDAPGFDVPENSNFKFFRYQKAGIRYITNVKNALIADPPGVGKTSQSIGAANYEGFNSGVVVCPTSLTWVWRREFEKFSARQYDIQVYSPKTFDKTKGEILIFPYSYSSRLESVRHSLEFGWHRGALDWGVFDEVHYLKENDSLRSQYLYAENGLFSQCKRIHAISGTPIVNRPIEVFNTIKRLAPELIDNMTRIAYGIKYCKGFQAPWGWDFRGASNMPELGARLRRGFMLRRKKEDVLPQLPEKFPPRIVYLNGNKKTDALNRETQTFDENSIFGKTDDVDFDKISTVRKDLAELKSKEAAEYIEAALNSGHEKIVVFAHHKIMVDELMDKLSEFCPVKFTGESSAKEKEAAVLKFQGDARTRLFIGSISAASVGLTLTASNYLIFAEISFVPGENEQAIDRCHRIGQTKAVQTDFLVHKNSLDERILKMILTKKIGINEFLEGV